MERNAHYTIVGLFTLVALLSMASFAFWIGKYGTDGDEYAHYKTYVYESVAGLKTSSPVKLKGIDVGFVETIALDKDDPQRIQIRFVVDKTVPIKTDSIVALNSQGIAGVGFLEIKGGTKNTPVLLKNGSDDYTKIPSEPSVFTQFTDKADRVLNNLSTTIAKVDQLASDKNTHNAAQSLENIAQITTEFKENRKAFTTMVKGVVVVENHTNHTLDEFTKMAQKSDAVLDEVNATAHESSLLLHEIKKEKLIEKLSTVLDNSNDTVSESKKLLKEGKKLVQQLRDSPSDLLFKSKSSPSSAEE